MEALPTKFIEMPQDGPSRYHTDTYSLQRLTSDLQGWVYHFIIVWLSSKEIRSKELGKKQIYFFADGLEPSCAGV